MIALLLSLMSPAHACGGLFCQSLDEPVDQSGEKIVFEVDEDEGKTTMDVLVSYQGPAEEFAWIVPVAGVPQLGISDPRLFSLIDARTKMRIQKLQTFAQTCEPHTIDTWFANDALDADPGAVPEASDDGAGGITIHAKEQVGPYDTVTLSGSSGEAVIGWLQENGYFFTDSVGPALDPYVADGQAFVALKLTKGNDAGDMEPLQLTWAGTTPAIPIQLTALAAQPDMPVDVYLLGAGRGIPTNYNHVVLNHRRIDWFRPNKQDMDELLSEAANEAGGHGFNTQSAIAGSQLAESIAVADLTESTFDSATTLSEVVDLLRWRQGVPTDTDLLNLLEASFPMDPLPEGASSAQDVFNCPDCYTPVAVSAEQAEAFSAAMYSAYVTWPTELKARLDGPTVTHLRSTLSPAEMTLDPMFSFNPDLAEVPALRTAQVEWDCKERTGILTFADGDWVEITADDSKPQGTDGMSAYMDDVTQLPAALRIEQMGESGPANPVVDNTPEPGTGEPSDVPSAEPTDVAGCGCNQGGSPAPWLALGLLVLPFRRRQR